MIVKDQKNEDFFSLPKGFLFSTSNVTGNSNSVDKGSK